MTTTSTGEDDAGGGILKHFDTSGRGAAVFAFAATAIALFSSSSHAQEHCFSGDEDGRQSAGSVCSGYVADFCHCSQSCTNIVSCNVVENPPTRDVCVNGLIGTFETIQNVCPFHGACIAECGAPGTFPVVTYTCTVGQPIDSRPPGGECIPQCNGIEACAQNGLPPACQLGAPENAIPEICGNYVDDDCDGDVDEEDCGGGGGDPCALPEVCNNGVDDDCDTLIDCADVNDCANNDLPEVCDNTIDDNCSGGADACDQACSQEEICGDDIDQDCDGLIDDDDPDLCNPPDDPLGPPKDCKEKCENRCAGKPVDLLTRHAYVGPHEDVRIASPQGGAFDLAFARIWDSLQADKDNDDDAIVDARTAQWPHPRVLGAGWRHSYDVRLILEGDAGGGQPVSLLFANGGTNERLFKVADDVFGRVPGRAMEATRTGTTWTLVDDDGTEYEFLEGGGAPTEMHPWENISLPPALMPFQEKALQKHARLRTIRPRGISGYRIRLWHEQDADAEPTVAPLGACIDVDQLGGCEPTRGLLVAVAAEWISNNQTQWRRGSSIELKYETIPATPGTRTQYLLNRVLEGADRDDGSATPTILAEYQHALGTHAWREALTAVASCADRTDVTGAVDMSGSSGIAELGARLFSYVPGAGDEAHLLARSQRPAVSSAGAFIVVDDEEFTWDASAGDAFRVSAHLSAGIELSAPFGAEDPDGEVAWSHNGFTRKVTFDAGWPIKRERCQGAACVTLRERQPLFQTLDSGLPGRLAVGNRVSVPAGGNTMTLREIDANGNVTHELEIVPTGSEIPILAIDDSSGVDVVTIVGNFTEVRRATRNYYVGAPPRLIATATYTSSDIHNPDVAATPAARRFPIQSAAETLGWIALDVSAAARSVPAHSASLGGGEYFFDVDVFDADSGVVDPDTEAASNGLLNENGEREIVWTHRVRTDASGGFVARSSRSVVDIWGRTHWMFEHENTSGASAMADERTLSKSHNTFRNNAAGTAARLRGQPLASERFPDASPASSTPAIVTWQACGAGSYDAHGKITCRETPQTPAALQVKEATSTAPSGALRTLVKTKAGSATRLQSFQDHFPGGPVFASGALGGNIRKTAWSSSLDATAATMPTQSVETDEAGTLLVRSTTTYDAYGRVLRQVVDDGVEDRRDTSYTYSQEDSTIDLVSRAVTSSTSVVRDWDVDPITGDVTRVVEEDGDEVLNTYATSGPNRGRLVLVERNGIEVQSFEYDVDGRVTAIWNGDEQAASYTYSEDGRLETESLHGVPIPTGGFLNREYLDELVQIGGAGPYYRASRTTTRSNTTVIRDLRTISDHLGRPLMQCDLAIDASCGNPLLRWVYDSKGAYVTGSPHVVEGTSRSVTLTNDNISGRLAYVTHPAGTTFFEYDALGRVTLQLTYSGALPPPALLDAARMKATDLTYFANTGELAKIRYPSGRAVEYRYGLDRRGPGSVLIKVDPNGANSVQFIASSLSYDVDGRAKTWNWNKSLATQASHTIERDMLGRVTRIRDLVNGVVKTELVYSGHDGDGDVAQIADNGPYATVLDTSFTASTPQTWSFAYGERDMLKDWTDVDGAHTTTIGDANGKRTSETIASSAFNYQYTGEMIDRRDSAGANANEVALVWAATEREVTAIDYGDDGSFELASLGYGSRGDLELVSTSAGRYGMRRDERMLRWATSYPISGHAKFFRYSPAGELIDQHEVTTGFERDEYIYLQGMPIGVTHTETARPSPRTWFLSPDAMGTPRRVLERDEVNFRQVSRLVMNAWGKVEQTDDFDELGWNGPRLPSLPFRLPGQIADEELLSLVENRWRAYLPDLGVYLQPDPAHQASASSYTGPQAYAYANGNPLTNVDPSGTFVLADEQGCKRDLSVFYNIVKEDMPRYVYDANVKTVFNGMFGQPGAWYNVFQTSGEDLLKQGCTWRSGPKLIVGNRSNRRWAHRAGDTILIDRILVERVQREPQISWFVRITLLHELAHWANDKAGTEWDVLPSEAGDVFERRAYNGLYPGP